MERRVLDVRRSKIGREKSERTGHPGMVLRHKYDLCLGQTRLSGDEQWSQLFSQDVSFQHRRIGQRRAVASFDKMKL